MISLLTHTCSRNRDDGIALGADAALFEAIELLDPEDRRLIEQLYFEEREETTVAAQYGIPQPTVSERKAKALSNLATIVGSLLRRTRWARRVQTSRS
jgi:DNA-directed RNA polymerase specialized sigma subunit